MPLEKYSALLWPWAWLSSAGRAAIVNMINATIAPIRFTTDSAASDNNPTEPVSKNASVFKKMVDSAAPIDNQAYFVSEERSSMIAPCEAECPADSSMNRRGIL